MAQTKMNNNIQHGLSHFVFITDSLHLNLTYISISLQAFAGGAIHMMILMRHLMLSYSARLVDWQASAPASPQMMRAKMHFVLSCRRLDYQVSVRALLRMTTWMMNLTLSVSTFIGEFLVESRFKG